MAIYLYSGAGGAQTGANWANAHITLANAFAAMVAGDDCYVAHDHAETQASAMTNTSPGTEASPCRVICVDRAGSVPPVAADLRATATISTTGANNMTNGGTCYYNGIIFSVGSTTSSNTLQIGNTSARSTWLENCSLRLAGSNGAGRIVLSGLSSQTGVLLHMKNVTFSFANVAQQVTVRGLVIWEATSDSAILGSVPTTLFGFSTTFSVNLRVIGVNLSAAGAAKNLLDQSVNIASSEYNFQDCKLGASVSISTGTIVGHGSAIVRAVNCGSGDTNYEYYFKSYHGTITHEATIVKTGGATDGVTTISRKMVSSATVHFHQPLKSDWITFYGSGTGSTTATVATVTDNVTLTDREAWLEVEYLGTNGFSLGSIASDAAANVLATAANQTTDGTSTWTTTGLTTPVKQSLATTFTTAEVGPYRARVCLAKASTTMYFDPKIATTSGRQHMGGEGVFVNEGELSVSAGVGVAVCYTNVVGGNHGMLSY